MSREASVFKQINQMPRFGYSQADIVRMSGLNKSSVSRFINGTTKDINLSNFLQLISSMPLEFQKLYWRQLLPEAVFGEPPRDWESLVSSASARELLKILQIAPSRFHQLIETGEIVDKDTEINEKPLCA